MLEQLFVRHSEVPYIAAFCKEVCLPGIVCLVATELRLCGCMLVT